MLFGGWTGSCAPGDKKAQNGSFVGLHAVSHFMPQRLQNVIKKTKRACQLLKFWIHVLDREIIIFEKFHVKIKFRSKVIVHEIRGMNFWDTLYLWNCLLFNIKFFNDLNRDIRLGFAVIPFFPFDLSSL